MHVQLYNDVSRTAIKTVNADTRQQSNLQPPPMCTTDAFASDLTLNPQRTLDGWHPINSTDPKNYRCYPIRTIDNDYLIDLLVSTGSRLVTVLTILPLKGIRNNLYSECAATIHISTALVAIRIWQFTGGIETENPGCTKILVSRRITRVHALATID